MRQANLIGAGALLLAACGEKPMTLAADPAERAATCGVVAATEARAAVADIKTPLSLEQQGDVLRYALLHASGGGSYDAAKAAAVVERMPAVGQDLNAKRVAALAPQCREAFPAPPSPAALPKDPLAAALGCEALGKFMSRALESQAEDYGSDLVRLAALNRVLDNRTAQLLRARGIAAPEAVANQSREAMAQIVGMGRPAQLLEACVGRYT